MGADASKENRKSSTAGSSSKTEAKFPNALENDGECAPWSLLHQCTVDNWKHGHAEAANFPDSILSCDRMLHKDCSAAFCMSRQGVINIDRPTSVFSFRRRTKFIKMAEHFEYNHIPAQMSSVNHFRVKSVVCFRDSHVVLHLSRNCNSQLGLLDLSINKFLGVFGKQPIDYTNESFSGELSPDKSKCLIFKPSLCRVASFPLDRFENMTVSSKVRKTYEDPSAPDEDPSISYPCGPRTNGCLTDYENQDDLFRNLLGPPSELLLFDMSSKVLLSRIPMYYSTCHFSFDPRHSWRRLAVTNFGKGIGENSLSLIELIAPPSFEKQASPLNNFSSFTTNGSSYGTSNLTTSNTVLTVKSQKPVEQQPKPHCDITEWTWSVTSMNERLNETWIEDLQVVRGSQRRHSTSSSSSSSSSSSWSPSILSDLSNSLKLVDLSYSRDGRLLIATMLELGECRCREKRSGGLRGVGEVGIGAAQRIRRMRNGNRSRHSNLPAVNCSLYVIDADTAQSLRCIQYQRYACRVHTCPTNYVPIFSACGTRMAVALDAVNNSPEASLPSTPLRPSSTEASGCRKRRHCQSPANHYVQVYTLPSPALCLQALCRSVVLKSQIPLSQLTLPPKILNYLKFGPEFSY